MTDLSQYDLMRLKACMKKAGHELTMKQLQTLYARHDLMIRSLPFDVLTTIIQQSDLKTAKAMCKSNKRLAKWCKENDVVMKKVKEGGIVLYDELLEWNWGGTINRHSLNAWLAKVFSEVKVNRHWSNRTPKNTALKIPLRDLLGVWIEPGPTSNVDITFPGRKMIGVAITRGGVYQEVAITSETSFVVSPFAKMKPIPIEPTMMSWVEYYLGDQMQIGVSPNILEAKGGFAEWLRDPLLNLPKSLDKISYIVVLGSRTNEHGVDLGHQFQKVWFNLYSELKMEYATITLWNHPTGVRVADVDV